MCSDALTPDQISDLVRRINDHQAVATLADCRDPSLVDSWMSGDLVPSAEQQKRLAFAQKCSETVTDDSFFRDWLKLNVVRSELRPLGPITPIEAMRLGDFKPIMGSTRHVRSQTVKVLPPVSSQ